MSDFAATDRRAVDAGCAGVEVHSANGYLLHQFFATGTQSPHRCLRQQHPLHHRSHRRHRRRTLRAAHPPRQHRHRHHRHRRLLPGPPSKPSAPNAMYTGYTGHPQLSRAHAAPPGAPLRALQRLLVGVFTGHGDAQDGAAVDRTTHV
ncbi:oxidoreductase [Streptomyces xiamenensis]|uniref:oxidoreductase n=1 Tax=Streptomyces xiamenensis TaxID=408015 RepID=UPI0037D7CD03